MYLEELSATNFQSFKQVKYVFLNGVPVLVVGENLTDAGQESNGSGKSVLMNIAEYCILHTTSKKVNDVNLVFWWDGSEMSELNLTIFCPLRKERLKIERKIAIKGSGQSQLSINGKVKYAFADKMVNEIDRFIIEWIGISKEDLQNFFILSKFKYVSFFNASNTNLIQLIGRFSNSSIIAGIDKDIMSQADAIETSKASLLERKNRLYGMIDVHKANMETERTIDREKLVQDELNRIDDLIIAEGDKMIYYETQIGLENEKITAHDEKLTELLTGIDKANAQLKKLKKDEEAFDKLYEAVDAKLATTKEQKEEKEKVLEGLLIDKQEVMLTIQEIDLNLKGMVTCPNCKFEFIAGKLGIDVDEEKQSLADSNNLIPLLDDSIAKARTALAEFDPVIKDIKKDRLEIEAQESTLKNLKRSITNSIALIEKEKNSIDVDKSMCQGRIQGYNNDIAIAQDRAGKLVKSKVSVTADSFDNTERLKAIENEIDSCTMDIIAVEEEEKLLNEEIMDIKTWAFTFKEFHQYLSVKTIKVLQGYANKFLADLGSDLRITLDGYKIKADGSLSEKITAYIIRDGEQKEFGNFSGGERVRLEAAMILTIQSAINSTNKWGGLNFLSIDEIFESIDSKGLNELTKSLAGLGKTIILTTHVANTNYDCEILKIVKVAGVSYIYNE